MWCRHTYHWTDRPRKHGYRRWNYGNRSLLTRVNAYAIKYWHFPDVYPDSGRHIGLQDRDMEKILTSFCREIISRKSHKSIPVGSKRFGSTREKIGLGGFFSPPVTFRGLRHMILTYCINGNDRNLCAKMAYLCRFSPFGQNDICMSFSKWHKTGVSFCPTDQGISTYLCHYALYLAVSFCPANGWFQSTTERRGLFQR